jgi:hypothetical protein
MPQLQTLEELRADPPNYLQIVAVKEDVAPRDMLRKAADS